jgi:hypothetical protein
MKKLLSVLVIMLSFVMQSFTILPGQTQVYLKFKNKIGGNLGPTKSDPDIESPVSVYLSEASDSLLLYSPSEESVIYYIYDADELEVCNGNVTFSEQGEASVYVGTLDEGIYTIYIVVDVDVYGGEFQL